MLYIPYSQKYWRELNLAVGPQVTMQNICRESDNLVWHAVVLSLAHSARR